MSADSWRAKCGSGPLDLNPEDVCMWCERDALKARVAELEAESAGRLKVLTEKATELAAEWRRAETAEGRVAELDDQVAMMASTATAMLRKAVADEREACAKAAYGHIDDWTCPQCDQDTAHDLAAEVDAAIRARGGK